MQLEDQWRSNIGANGAAAPLGIIFMMFAIRPDPLTFCYFIRYERI